MDAIRNKIANLVFSLFEIFVFCYYFNSKPIESHWDRLPAAILSFLYSQPGIELMESLGMDNLPTEEEEFYPQLTAAEIIQIIQKEKSE